MFAPLAALLIAAPAVLTSPSMRGATLALAAAAPAGAKAGASAAPAPTPSDTMPVVTHHDITVDGKPLRYTVTTGMLPLRNDTGEIEARIFFVAYSADGRGSAA